MGIQIIHTRIKFKRLTREPVVTLILIVYCR
jgi:hypothetical protein